MIFLPIIERELRLRARSWAMYLVRVGAAAVGLVICLQQFSAAAPLRTPAMVGQSVFDALVSAAFLLSCSGCLLAADSISTERREGTLGVLLLTGVNSSEVLVAKFASAALAGVCMLVAFLPALILPVLAGGVQSSEAFRNGAALLGTLWFALGAGLCGSAVSRDRSKANVRTVLGLAVILLIPYWAFWANAGGLLHWAGAISPLSLMATANRKRFAASPAPFWVSLAMVHLAGWFLLIGAGLLLRRVVREDNAAPVLRLPKAKAEAKRQVGLARWEPDKENAGPVEWLIYRQRGVGAGIWVIAVLGLVCSRWIAFLLQGFQGFRTVSTTAWFLALPLGLGAALLGGAMVALVASRFFATVRRSGELELLLTTPLGAVGVISEQWKVLQRVFLWPMLGIQAALLVPLLAALSGGSGARLPSFLLVSLGLNLANTFLGTYALCWLGMRFGLGARSPTAAIIWTAGLAEGAPWILTLAAGWIPWLPDLAILVFYIVLIATTKERLERMLADGIAAPIESVRPAA